MPSTDINGQPILILSVEEAMKVLDCLVRDERITVDDPLFEKVLKFKRDCLKVDW